MGAGRAAQASATSGRRSASGLLGGLAYAALDTYLLRGKAPWTLHHHPDHEQLKPAASAPPIDYPKPDGKLTFDRLSSVFISQHQPRREPACHLRLKDPRSRSSGEPRRVRRPRAALLPGRGLRDRARWRGGAPRLQINAQNCVHCKTCDIKDPAQNIDWVVPEGGDGPNYVGM